MTASSDEIGRKLTAILVADVVVCSRLAGADEDRILARLRTLRSDLIDPTIAARSFGAWLGPRALSGPTYRPSACVHSERNRLK